MRTGVVAPPITYTVDGEQYVAVLAGWGGAFALSADGALIDNMHPVRNIACMKPDHPAPSFSGEQEARLRRCELEMAIKRLQTPHQGNRAGDKHIAALGQRVEPGQPLLRIHAADRADAEAVTQRLRGAFTLSETDDVAIPPLIHATLREGQSA